MAIGPASRSIHAAGRSIYVASSEIIARTGPIEGSVHSHGKNSIKRAPGVSLHRSTSAIGPFAKPIDHVGELIDLPGEPIEMDGR